MILKLPLGVLFLKPVPTAVFQGAVAAVRAGTSCTGRRGGVHTQRKLCADIVPVVFARLCRMALRCVCARSPRMPPRRRMHSEELVRELVALLSAAWKANHSSQLIAQKANASAKVRQSLDAAQQDWQRQGLRRTAYPQLETEIRGLLRPLWS